MAGNARPDSPSEVESLEMDQESSAHAERVKLTPGDWQLNFSYTPANLPRILALRDAMLAQSEEFRKTTAWEKGMSRLEDARQIAAGEATAAEVQERNAAISSELIRAAKFEFDPIAFRQRSEALLSYVLEIEASGEPFELLGPWR